MRKVRRKLEFISKRRDFLGDRERAKSMVVKLI